MSRATRESRTPPCFDLPLANLPCSFLFALSIALSFSTKPLKARKPLRCIMMVACEAPYSDEGRRDDGLPAGGVPAVRASLSGGEGGFRRLGRCRARRRTFR